MYNMLDIQRSAMTDCCIVSIVLFTMNATPSVLATDTMVMKNMLTKCDAGMTAD